MNYILQYTKEAVEAGILKPNAMGYVYADPTVRGKQKIKELAKIVHALTEHGLANPEEVTCVMDRENFPMWHVKGIQELLAEGWLMRRK